MIAREHARLFGRKPEPVLFRLERVDALEQRLVQIGSVAMAGESRRDLALDRLQFVVGRGAGEIEENAGDPVEAAAGALERLDRVGEGGRRRVNGDGVDLAPRVLQGGVEGWPEMAGLDAVERRRLERPGPGFEKRVRVGNIGQTWTPKRTFFISAPNLPWERLREGRQARSQRALLQ